MFVIRPQQMEMLAQHSQKRFEERLIQHVGEQFPEETESLGREGLRMKVRTCIETAHSYGIRSEVGIALFTDASIALGSRDLSAVPGVQTTLCDDEFDGDTKARKVCDQTILYIDEQDEKLDID